MFNMIEKGMSAARKYTVVDYGFYKLLMISFGILLGVYFPQPFLNIIWLVWVVLIVSAVWMIYKLFKYAQ